MRSYLRHKGQLHRLTILFPSHHDPNNDTLSKVSFQLRKGIRGAFVDSVVPYSSKTYALLQKIPCFQGTHHSGVNYDSRVSYASSLTQLRQPCVFPASSSASSPLLLFSPPRHPPSPPGTSRQTETQLSPN